jgi:ABC-2 type transport system ATP-binding protein
MKQKIALVAALIHAPKLMLLDEPFVGLDPKSAATLKSYMTEVCNSGGAIFFSTHVLDVAEKLCNRVAIIKNGKLVIEGDMITVKGNESLEDVFLELTEDTNA